MAAERKDSITAVVGTYERTLCGWEVREEDSMEPVFNHPVHLGPIKAVAAAGRMLVSGGSDEEIRCTTLDGYSWLW